MVNVVDNAELNDWVHSWDGCAVLQKPAHRFGILRHDVRILQSEEAGGKLPPMRDKTRETLGVDIIVSDSTHVMLIEHDWSRVFPLGSTKKLRHYWNEQVVPERQSRMPDGAELKNADNATMWMSRLMTYRSPYPMVAFEMQLNGRAIVVVMRADQNGRVLRMPMLYVQLSKGWTVVYPGMNIVGLDDSATGKLLDIMTEAVCRHVIGALIALDARAAEPEPAVYAAPRINTRFPTAGYHWHSLCVYAKKNRTCQDDANASDYKGVVRLHWRRGHWRRETTWVRAHLVGNPNLGFIDKEYRIK